MSMGCSTDCRHPRTRQASASSDGVFITPGARKARATPGTERDPDDRASAVVDADPVLVRLRPIRDQGVRAVFGVRVIRAGELHLLVHPAAAVCSHGGSTLGLRDTATDGASARSVDAGSWAGESGRGVASPRPHVRNTLLEFLDKERVRILTVPGKRLVDDEVFAQVERHQDLGPEPLAELGRVAWAI